MTRRNAWPARIIAVPLYAVAVAILASINKPNDAKTVATFSIVILCAMLLLVAPYAVLASLVSTIVRTRLLVRTISILIYASLLALWWMIRPDVPHRAFPAAYAFCVVFLVVILGPYAALVELVQRLLPETATGQDTAARDRPAVAVSSPSDSIVRVAAIGQIPFGLPRLLARTTGMLAIVCALVGLGYYVWLSAHLPPVDVATEPRFYPALYSMSAIAVACLVVQLWCGFELTRSRLAGSALLTVIWVFENVYVAALACSPLVRSIAPDAASAARVGAELSFTLALPCWGPFALLFVRRASGYDVRSSARQLGGSASGVLWRAVVRDVAVILGLTYAGYWTIGAGAGFALYSGSDSSLATLTRLSEYLVRAIGFTVSAHFAGAARWRHLSFVAVSLWVVQTILFSSPNPLFLVWTVVVGGGLSHVFATFLAGRPPTPRTNPLTPRVEAG